MQNYIDKQLKVGHNDSFLIHLFFNISTASLICLVLAVIGWPKVECERKATFGSKPNNFATLDAEIAISESCSDVGYS